MCLEFCSRLYFGSCFVLTINASFRVNFYQGLGVIHIHFSADDAHIYLPLKHTDKTNLRSLVACLSDINFKKKKKKLAMF